MKKNIKVHKYKNGLTLIVQNNKKCKEISFLARFNAGSAVEDKNVKGVAHLLEHLIAGALNTKNKTAKELNEYFYKYNVHKNASTSYLYTEYYFTSLPKFFNDIFVNFAERLSSSVFTEEIFNKEKGVVYSEYLGVINNKSRNFTTKFIEFYHDDYKFSNIAGDEKTIKNLKMQDAIDFKNKYYTPNNCILLFAGPIFMRRAKKLVETNLSIVNEKSQDVEIITTENDSVKPERKIYIHEDDSERIELILYFSANRTVLNDYIIQGAISNLLGNGGFYSRLYQALRVNKGLVYSCSAYTSKIKGYSFEIKTLFDKNNLSEVLSTIADIIKDVKTGGFSDLELSNYKQRREIQMLIDYYYSSSLNDININDYNSFKKFINKNEILKSINNLSNDDLTKTINDIFQNDHVVIGAMGKDLSEDDFKIFQI